MKKGTIINGFKTSSLWLGAIVAPLIWGGIGSILFTSCIDTEVLPIDKTIEEDYWKNKAEVELMVNGAYSKMVNSNVITRLLLWGEMRSDELIINEQPTGTTPTALKEIQIADITPANTFANWASVYSVINQCNVVLEHAEKVMSIDPSYTNGDYLAHRSQMLALRSLCYFYLVRTFRDVPYSSVAFQNSSQDLMLPLTAPAIVLQHCIDDLKEAVDNNPLKADTYGDNNWQRVGLLHEEGILALLADIYLWRASLTHSEEDYQACVDCCHRLTLSKQARYVKDPLDPDASDYPLEPGNTAFAKLFVDNEISDEVIFELQMNGTNNSNNAVRDIYYRYSRNAANGYCYASKLFSSWGTGSDYAFHTNQDYRYWMSTYDVGSSTLQNFGVRKMVTSSTRAINPTATPVAFHLSEETREYSNYFAQNWIVYRMPDVMLMEAEALTAMASGDGDPLLDEAFALVREVNKRSLAIKTNAIVRTDYPSKEDIEKLVLEERQRELCYEGKRWWDLMRYNYRHITPADPNKTLYELKDEGQAMPATDDAMLTLVVRRYDEGQKGIKTKMSTESQLYWPIYESEIKANSNLHQNPAYTNEL